MHPALADEIVKTCRTRERDGDCPTVDRPGTELMEFCILELAEQRDKAATKALRTLSHAVLKFAPDLAQELVRRWHTAREEQDAAFCELMALLQQPTT